jgi:hypothetical protein
MDTINSLLEQFFLCFVASQEVDAARILEVIARIHSPITSRGIKYGLRFGEPDAANVRDQHVEDARPETERGL